MASETTFVFNTKYGKYDLRNHVWSLESGFSHERSEENSFSQKFAITYLMINIFEISAKFLTFLHQHFRLALPSPVEIVCSMGVL